MCLGIPGEVIELMPEHPDLARVDVSGVKRAINIGLLTDDPPVSRRLDSHSRRFRAI